MLANNVKPDGVTFIGVLSACSRAGLVEKGRSYFDSMVKDHGIVPITDHYTCMIDLFSRAGRLNEAEEFIKGMPCQPDAIGWATLLSSCRLRGNIEIGKWAAENLLETDPQNPASYVLLSSMYAAKGQWDEVSRLRRGMRDRRVKKEPGCSWIKYKNEVHIFSADDQSHPYSKRILEELDKLMDKMIEEGYKPDMSSVLHDVGEAEKIQMLGHHSEKLAIAFGLVFIPKGMPIRVVKNLRVCGDCHNATKFISRISGRDILGHFGSCRLERSNLMARTSEGPELGSQALSSKSQGSNIDIEEVAVPMKVGETFECLRHMIKQFELCEQMMGATLRGTHGTPEVGENNV
uniref:DYW domain-containing protein n=1 Tax=Ananas comosus var. bracteatus TaxID=296719 RepID=A0A6V7PKI5_ANACO|nr:unnamed protein product [Ananas comosus var. bracteatus]